MRSTVVAVTILGVMLLGSDRGPSQTSSSGEGHSGEPVRFTSMVELIVRPETYEGVLIEVKGFYGGPFPALFLSREHAGINDLDSAFLVADETEGFITKHCAGHYVQIEGRFKRRLGGLMGGDPENFIIDDVTQIDILGDSKTTTCWPRKDVQDR